MNTSLITKADLNIIVSNAKSRIVSFSTPLYISDKEVESSELASLAILESVIMHLNGKKLLTNMVTVDYTSPGAAHDPDQE